MVPAAPQPTSGSSSFNNAMAGCVDKWSVEYPTERFDWRGHSCHHKRLWGQCHKFKSSCAKTCGLCPSATRPPDSQDGETPLAAALSAANGHVFAIVTPARRHWLGLTLNTLGLNRSMVSLVAAFRSDAFQWPVLQRMAHNGSISSALWNRTIRVRQQLARGERVSEQDLGAVITPSRMAVLRSHQLAQRRFLSSGKSVGFFLEDDVTLTSTVALSSHAMARTSHAAEAGRAPAATGPLIGGIWVHVQQRLEEAVGTSRIGWNGGVSGHAAHATAPTTAWEMLFLGFCWEHCSPTASRSAVHMSRGGYMRMAVQPMCLHSYLTRRSASRKLLAAIEDAPISAPIDMLWSKRLIRPRHVLAKVVVPPLLMQARDANVPSTRSARSLDDAARMQSHALTRTRQHPPSLTHSHSLALIRTHSHSIRTRFHSFALACTHSHSLALIRTHAGTGKRENAQRGRA